MFVIMVQGEWVRVRLRVREDNLVRVGSATWDVVSTVFDGIGRTRS